MFGQGSFWGVAGSTSAAEVTFTCNGDTRGAACVSGASVVADSYSGPEATYASTGTFSAYVNGACPSQLRRERERETETERERERETETETETESEREREREDLGGLTRGVETPSPSKSPHYPMILRERSWWDHTGGGNALASKPPPNATS